MTSHLGGPDTPTCAIAAELSHVDGTSVGQDR
jgi:hypothetical protein